MKIGNDWYIGTSIGTSGKFSYSIWKNKHDSKGWERVCFSFGIYDTEQEAEGDAWIKLEEIKTK